MAATSALLSVSSFSLVSLLTEFLLDLTLTTLTSGCERRKQRALGMCRKGMLNHRTGQ